MKLIKDYEIVKNKKRICLFFCERCEKEVEHDKYDHTKRIKNEKPFCPVCTNELRLLKKRSLLKKPSIINNVKIITHYEIEYDGAKRYVLAECPLCNDHTKKRYDSIKDHPLCKKCGNKKGAELRTKHGLCGHALFTTWCNIIARCEYDYATGNKWYKDKNVSMCKEWRENFKIFYDWSLGNGYSRELELDKDILCDSKNISPKIYSPETCLWITKKRNVDYARTINS